MSDIEYKLDDIIFNWNETKAKVNKKKHGITFEDINALILDDKTHSYDEERFISNLLVVCHCYRYNGSITRIISARKATNEERRTYEGEFL